ncbi:MAG TPA: hypothetical protein VGM31_00570, partial [Puia sp.]
MQLKSKSEQELVRICMAELCARTNLPHPDMLVQRDLVALCDNIESNTGILISLSTVKRLINGQFSRLPQVATLDAIAVSAGYQNWRDFTQVQSRSEAQSQSQTQSPSQSRSQSQPQSQSNSSLPQLSSKPHEPS